MNIEKQNTERNDAPTPFCDCSEIKNIRTLVLEAFQHFAELFDPEKKIEPGLSTGYPDLDHLLGGGFKKQEMVVLAARPSIGKTAFALNIARFVAMKNAHGERRRNSVAFFSLEMSAERVSQRLLCTEAKVSLSSLMDRSFNVENMHKLTTAAAALSKANIFVDPAGGLLISELRTKAKKLKESPAGLDLIIIDYLQLMRVDDELSGDNRHAKLSSISNSIKRLAKELDVPILVLSYLNREVDRISSDDLPHLRYLRDGGSIVEDADVVMLLHRDRDKEKGKQGEDRISTEALLQVKKNRNGKIGEVKLRFFPALMEFRPAAHGIAK